MRKRDLAILLISAFSVFISLQNEGPFSFKHGFLHFIDDVDNPILHESDRLPLPVVFDLNGDGKKEIILTTHDGKLQVLEPRIGNPESEFRQAKVLKEVIIQPREEDSALGNRAVALSAGHLEAVNKTGRSSRKGVIVVITASWTVLCYDHNLKLMWENTVQENLPHNAFHKEVAILISNQTMKAGDKGVVIVGGSLDINLQKYHDSFKEEDEEMERENIHRKSAGINDSMEDVSNDLGGLKEKHFSYYAFEGKTGNLRWHHNSQDFHRDHSQLSEKLLPQHNYKLDANSLNSRHFGEVECREYRESVLHSMPHHWERREDTRFELVHFRKHRRHSHKKQNGKNSIHRSPPSKFIAGKNTNNKLAKMVGKTINVAKSSKNLKDVKHGNLSAHWWAPNAIVAHLKEGIEAIHLYSGRTICKLLLPPGGLHADINGDGVLDHVQANGAHGGEQTFLSPHEFGTKPCFAFASSGVPIKENLFNGSICKPHFPFSHSNEEDENHMIEVSVPTLFPTNKKKHASKGDVIFLTSKGDLTCFQSEKLYGAHANHGSMRWQIQTEVMWHNPAAPEGTYWAPVVPTLTVIPLFARKHAPDAILAVGEDAAAVVSPSGNVLTTFSFPSAPVSPVLITDFNNDGLNDVVVVSQDGVYGLFQIRQPGAVLFSALLGCIVIVLSVVIVTQHLANARGKPRGSDQRRSTDF